MKFVQAQFSLKYEPQVMIRRHVNEIEDFTKGYYGVPQTVPIPDEIAPDAPRVILDALNGHSQIRFSQISVDCTIQFDGEYLENFECTKKYIMERIALLKKILENMDIKTYYFCGITYNIHLDIEEKEPVEYMRTILNNENLTIGDLYEVSIRSAKIEDNCYFVNQQIGTYREYQGNKGNIVDLFDFSSAHLISHGVNLTLDINNRYKYLHSGMSTSIDDSLVSVEKIYELLEKNIQKWR